MTNISGWVTFREIVDSVQLAEGDSADSGQFLRKLNFAIKGYEQLRLHHLPAMKTVTMAITTEMRVVVLPEDYLKFISCGIWYEDAFYKFLPKSGAVINVEADCGVDTRTVPDDTEDVEYFYGYYSLDIENRRIIIDAPSNVTQIMLNYTPTGVRMDGITYIPRMCRAVIEAYVENQVVMRDKNTAWDKNTFALEYVKQLMIFRGLQFNTDEIMQEYYDHINQGKQY